MGGGGSGNKQGMLQRGNGSGPQQPGSRRELPNEKGKVQPMPGQSTRPGTAPQNLNGLLSSNSQTKPNRPMSPFTKVYNNQLGAAGSVRSSGGTKPRSNQIRTGGLTGGVQPQKRQVGGSQGPIQQPQS